MERHDIFSDADPAQIKEHGLSEKEVRRQIAIFKRAAPHLHLVRPAIQGDGIEVISPKQIPSLMHAFENRPSRMSFLKFVPASGAASRMFKILLAERRKNEEVHRDVVAEKAASGDAAQQALLRFMDGLAQFAFYKDLAKAMAEKGMSMDEQMGAGRYGDILSALLDPSGLNYAELPKGLLKFHDYGDEQRTAFEEHLVEAAFYGKDDKGRCRLHFTVSPEHMLKFKDLLETVRPVYEKEFQADFRVDFSVQKNATDTIAVDLDNRPFRDGEGRLLFRPGGHGALIENVNDLDADVVFIKNIDNVVPDRLKEETFKWKKILAGYLLGLKDRIDQYLNGLSEGEVDETSLDQITVFSKEKLHIHMPEHIQAAPLEERRSFLFKKLNRPIRVCGMVRNQGEPGGGPFWVASDNNQISLQIVEKAQVNMDSPDQEAVFKASTHFNPVDLVCAVKDWQGKPFDLRRYVDKDAVFISKKSKNGRDLKALEHPGLWNGSMSDWITLFVEVLIITFNPVKTVNDLLRKEHQPQ